LATVWIRPQNGNLRSRSTRSGRPKLNRCGDSGAARAIPQCLVGRCRLQRPARVAPHPLPNLPPLLKLSHPASCSKVHPPRESILVAKPRELPTSVRASRDGMIYGIWTRHPLTSWTIRCLPQSTGSSSTRSMTTMPSGWTPRSSSGRRRRVPHRWH
jgi:hypothetical protein